MPSTFKKTVETVLATGNHLLVQLKGNHPKLLAAVWTLCQSQPHAEQHYTVDLGGRAIASNSAPCAWGCSRGQRH